MLENTGQKQIKITDNMETKHNPEKANNTKLKHSKTKLPSFGHLLQHSARKRGGLIPQRSEPTLGTLGGREC